MTTHPLRLPGVARRVRDKRAFAATGLRVIPLLFYTFLVVALFFAMIYLRIALDRTAFELDSIERSIELEESRTFDLRLELAELQDPIRIANEAERLGMTHPDEQRTLIVAERPLASPTVPPVRVSAYEGLLP